LTYDDYFISQTLLFQGQAIPIIRHFEKDGMNTLSSGQHEIEPTLPSYEKHANVWSLILGENDSERFRVALGSGNALLLGNDLKCLYDCQEHGIVKSSSRHILLAWHSLSNLDARYHEIKRQVTSYYALVSSTTTTFMLMI
jgi:hypothetical protein